MPKNYQTKSTTGRTNRIDDDDHDGDRKNNDSGGGATGGVRFGTGVDIQAFDDNAILYGGGGGSASAIRSNDQYVTELPTALEEEEEEANNDNDRYHANNRQQQNSVLPIDEGRVAYHPSTARSNNDGNDDEGGYHDGSDPFDHVNIGGSIVVNTRISDRESDYQKRRNNRVLLEEGTSFKDAMKHAMIEKEKHELIQQLKQEEGENDEKFQHNSSISTTETNEINSNDTTTMLKGNSDNGTDGVVVPIASTSQPRRKRRWDASGPTVTTKMQSDESDNASVANVTDNESVSTTKNEWDEDITSHHSTTNGTKTSKQRRTRWDETPMVTSSTNGSNGSSTTATTIFDKNQATPLMTNMKTSHKWDETPIITTGRGSGVPGTLFVNSSTPAVSSGSTGVTTSRWDATPLPAASTSSTTQDGGAGLSIAGNLTKAAALEREMESRNRPWTDAALDAILPAEGYVVLPPPANYIPLRTPGRSLLLSTPGPSFRGGSTNDGLLLMTPAGFQMEVPMEQRTDVTIQDIREAYGVPLAPDELTNAEAQGGSATAMSNLPFIKADDMQFFGRLMEETDEEKLNKEEVKERQIMSLLLKIKNGTPPQRKTSMRQITEKARSFGAGPLFNQILPLLMSPTLEDQERHLLVKVIDRVLYKLDDLVRPYVHRILAVIEPLLIDEDYYARVEGREIISNLAKAAGLATMIATMRPDIDSPDEHVRNTTSRAFAVVASALGVPALLPFLKAVCQSRKSWQARHTGIKIVQQIALLMGVAVLPYLQELVDIVSHGLTDEIQKVKIITALTCAALAEAAHPYGIESFDSVIRPLWKGAMEQHSKALAAFLKAIGFVIPLMEENYASHYTKLVMPILLREFHSPDEEMKRIVLKVIQQCVATAGVEPEYIRKEILPEFFRNFWIRRMALDRRNYNQVIETTEELANKVGCSDIIIRIVNDLKDDSEPYRRMVMETVKRVLDNLGASDIDERLEEQLIDGMLYAFQEQAIVSSTTSSSGDKEGQIMLDGFGTVVNALGERCKPYLKQIAGTIKWRLNNKAASVRMQAADLIGRIALVMKACGEDQLMGHLGVVLYEYLGEEYPEVLGSILGALRSIVNVIGMTKMTPPIRDLLPRLTPILRNRHEKVQENVIDLVGRIADRGHEFVSAKEWMRICFELLEMVRAHKKAIRRAAVSTFGFIAKAIGPQDVLHTLLNNLKVQDRQMRVCTTVAIAIVSETCGPFTVLPALMNEYRVPELNVQNGVLKTLSFMFEYIGSMGKDYVYAIAPLLVDALMERDPVHRQTACATVKHLALGVAGCGCEDVLLHLLNYVWPNIFEESPHVIQAVFDAIQGLMVALGPSIILQYTIQGLYHPARNVRAVYWRIYNCLYIYNADALIPSYPVVENDYDHDHDNHDDFYNNTYERTSLQLFI